MENGEYTYQHIRRRTSRSRSNRKNQERFSHLNEEHIAKMQAFITAKTKAPGKPIEFPSWPERAGVSSGSGTSVRPGRSTGVPVFLPVWIKK